MFFLIAGIIVVASPAALLTIIGLSMLFRHRLSEQLTGRLTSLAVILGLTGAFAVLAMMLVTGERLVPIELGHWVALEIKDPHLQVHHATRTGSPAATPEPGTDSSAGHQDADPGSHVSVDPDTQQSGNAAQHKDQFHFTIKFVFDRLSVPFAILSFVLCGVIGAFASTYLHRDEGFHRFFLFYAVFLLGMIVSSLAGTIETLFFGWELVGLSSALLVAFFHNRQNPVRNGLRVWSVYRVADAAFLMAALTLHHLSSGGDFEALMGQGAWPSGHAGISAGTATFVGLLLLIAAAGKSGLVPFSGWLPRAMEGPTPSSAVFYGALSVHLGAFLLLRVSALLPLSLTLRIAVISLGVISMIFAATASRVQTDIKSALAFSSLTQVSIIVIEIGCGLHYIPLIHIIGHASMRTLQLVRAPSLLKDYHMMENAMGRHLPQRAGFWSRVLPAGFRRLMYRVAVERGFFDPVLDDFVVRPFVRVFEWSERMEQRWMSFLEGPPGHTTADAETAMHDESELIGSPAPGSPPLSEHGLTTHA